MMRPGTLGNNMKMKTLAALSAACILSGCGSITRGTSEPVYLSAKPEGAEITTSLGHRCKSPCTVTVDRKTKFTAYAEHPGYHRGTLEIGTKVSGTGATGFAGNVLIGGVIGMGVDAATGAALDHHPNPAQIVLVPVDATNPKTPPQISFADEVKRDIEREKAKSAPST